MGEQKNGKSCFMTGLQVSTGNGTHTDTHTLARPSTHVLEHMHTRLQANMKRKGRTEKVIAM